MIRSRQGTWASAAASTRSETPCQGLRVPTNVTTGAPFDSGWGAMRCTPTPLATVCTRPPSVCRRTQARTGSETHTVAEAALTCARSAAQAKGASTRSRCRRCSSMRGALTSRTVRAPSDAPTRARAVLNRE